MRLFGGLFIVTLTSAFVEDLFIFSALVLAIRRLPAFVTDALDP